MKRVLPLFIFVLLTITAFSQTPDTTRHSKVRLSAEFEHFFRDNEFSAEKISGYTLPGFYFRPRLVWNVEKRVHLEAGLHWLHYWGATSYPALISFSAFPEMGENPRSSHVLPWMRASIDLLPQMTLVFGSLKNDNGHNLPRPLYDPELLYAADPEAGIQMLLDFKYFDADIWMDWKEFIFRGSETQERFIFGFSGKSDLLQDKLVNLSIPVNVLTQHTGGEMLTQEMDPITVFNFAGGVELTYNGRVQLKTGCNLMGFVHNGNAALPFRQGWGVYPHIGMDFKGLAIDIAYWHGDDFVPLLGSPHFSSISLNTPGLVFDPMDMLVVNASYKMRQFRYTTLSFDALSYIYFPYSGNRPGYTKVERGAAASFSFGFNLKINPLQPLQRKKSLKKAISMPNF